MLVLPALHHRPVCSWWRIYQHNCACLLQAEKHAAQNGAANGDVPAADGKGLAPVNTHVEDKTYDSDENDEIRYRIRVEAARGELPPFLVHLCSALPQAHTPHLTLCSIKAKSCVLLDLPLVAMAVHMRMFKVKNIL